MVIVRAPEPIVLPSGGKSVFLAGSIDMGEAELWQRRAAALLDDVPDLTILDPRRDRWDLAATPSSTDPCFREQATWELDGLARAQVIAMYLAGGSKSPVSLLELGLYARSGKLLVGCAREFWRRGNVEVVAQRYGVPLVESLEQLMALTRERLLRPG